MNLASIIIVAVALGADAFSLALAIGLAGVGRRMIWRLSGIIAVFHIFMPLAGLFAGQTLGIFLGGVAKAVGALILVWLGLRMIYSVYRPDHQQTNLSNERQSQRYGKLPKGVSLNGIGIYALAASVSLDALSVGFSLGTLGSKIILSVLIMGGTAGLMTFAGLLLGRVLGTWAGQKAEFMGGLALILIGLKIFL